MTKGDIAFKVWLVYEVSDCCPNLISEIIGVFKNEEDAEYHVGIYRRGAKIKVMELE